MRRREQPAATVYPGKSGTATVILPDGTATHADDRAEALAIAYRAGAILIRWKGNLHRPRELSTTTVV